MALLQVDQLTVHFDTPDGAITAVNGLSFSLEAGQTLGIVGESGSGKSQTVLALMGLLARNGRCSGRARLGDEDLLALAPGRLNQLRGNRIAMIFQDPMTALNPYLTIERQMTEVLEWHRGANRTQARQSAIAALDAVRIPQAVERLGRYPHEFSGGMRQRVMIAMALLCEPDVLIADEPTTALDVTVQAQILDLLRDLQRERGTAIIAITHDLGVVAELCHDVMVMYGGRVMETGDVETIFHRPSHPYTLGLLGAVPRMDQPRGLLTTIPGSPPNMAQLPSGCPFAPRCSAAEPRCQHEQPLLNQRTGIAHASRACWRADSNLEAARPHSSAP